MKLDAIFVINLESDAARRERMEGLVKRYHLEELAPVVFFKAEDAREKAAPASFRGNGGAYGCTLSHLGVLREISRQNLKNVLVAEDDLIFHKNFRGEIREALTTVPVDFEVAYLGATQICWSGIEVDGGWYRAKNTLGTTAYIVRDRAVADALVGKWTGALPIDEFYSSLQSTQDHRFYVRFPNVIIQDVEDSHTRGASWTMENVSRRLRWNLEDYDTS